MKKAFLISFGIICSGSLLSLNAQNLPIWLERDSVSAINNRIKNDFSLTLDEGLKTISELYPNVDVADYKSLIENHYIEVKTIDGNEMMHRKSPNNFKLLYPTLRPNWKGRGSQPDAEDIEMVKSIIDKSKGIGDITNGKKIKYRFTIKVPKHEFLVGDTLKVWMPVPIESPRQKNIKIHSVSHQNYILSNGGGSEHNTIYIEQPINATTNDTIIFEYVGEYDTYGQYFSSEYIIENIKPYDKTSDLYKKYTDISHKHIIDCKLLAKEIVGNETCPYKQSEMIYEYISKTYPWAGAREYSTIESLPQYVLDELHGDCGQVSLLYISLMRSLGVPAKWESGWMLHPWSKNLHDWAEVYFEGIGWVPVDVSFGRYVNSNNRNERNFFSTGMDCYRFATNTGICSPLYPNKKYTRSETVDFQVGEVECSKGNLFYPGWTKRLEVLSIIEIKD